VGRKSLISPAGSVRISRIFLTAASTRVARLLATLTVALAGVLPGTGQPLIPSATVPVRSAVLVERAATGTLAVGTVLHLRLTSAVSTKTSHLHQSITAKVVREVTLGDSVAIPLGAPASGRIEKLIPASNPADRARLLLGFTRLEIPGQSPVTITGHVTEVGNAREQVLSDGTIQGVLASELPRTPLEGQIAKIGQANPAIGEEIRKTLGQADTSISFPEGTDLRLVLDKPLPIQRLLQTAVPDQLPQDLAAEINRLLNDAPQRSSSKDGQPGDPLNLVVLGTPEQVVQAFQQAGWSQAEKKNTKSVLGTIRAVMGDEGYGTAPVSDLYLYGHAEDFAFEKMLNTFVKRHHLRLWRAPVTAPDGRPIWLGAATHDTGIDIHPGVVSHATDPDLDDERAQVGADLAVGGRVAVETLVTRPSPLTSGFTATGGAWKTDGRLLVLDLK